MANGKVIKVDEEVFKKIEKEALPFETPNHILRRLLGLPPSKIKRGRPLKTKKGK